MGDNKPYLPGDLLAAFPRPKGERLAVMFREYGGHHFAELRVQFQAEDGSWRPTKTGCTVKLGELEGVVAALGGAVERAKAL